ncbi:conjugal transfer protein MobC [Pedobacter frigoris]|uniref:conjugal transfer protein MobC n=1 Tax=Pedobacter frigoris TaxID=2571272 RepID=UPI0029318215|nr:conjugal transfer protein MobC [Pedobacter frigoris]
MSTGENEQALRKILDMTRLMAIAILILHFYYYCYGLFNHFHLTTALTNKLLGNIAATGIFKSFYISKLIALGMLTVSLMGAKGKKDEKLSYKSALAFLLPGLLTYFISGLILLAEASSITKAWLYITVTSAGFLLIVNGGVLLSRIIKDRLKGDIFNKDNETFPQEERLLQNEYSVNLPAKYHLKGKVRKSWINVINPFRGLLVCGSPGAGKSYFVIRHVITQHIEKGFSMFVYDFKFDDLSVIAYNAWLKNKHKYKVPSKFYVINFDDLNRSHRCNPLDPSGMFDITDASESARTILLGLNKTWITKQGDFFVDSPINFLSAIIWYLRKYRNGAYCTLPHVIELMMVDYSQLFTIMRRNKELEPLLNPFYSAFLNDAMEQLEGQIASAKIAMARLASPSLYYVLSGSDFTLDINNPESPKILCAGNNPQKIQIYGAVLSLYVNRLIKLVNKKDKLKSSLVFDEFPTIYLNNVDGLIATARSNKVATTLGLQDMSQLRKDYGKEQADVIMNIVGNVVSGQVTGDTAKQLSERFGKIMQDRESLSINRTDTSVSKSKQLESAVPPSTIAGLSSGEFVGMVADDPDNKIALKTFHAEIQNDHAGLKKEMDNYKPMPLIRDIDNSMVQANYNQIKQDIQDIVQSEMEQIMRTPELKHLIIRK